MHVAQEELKPIVVRVLVIFSPQGQHRSHLLLVLYDKSHQFVSMESFMSMSHNMQKVLNVLHSHPTMVTADHAHQGGKYENVY